MQKSENCIAVIFGASGDLTKRKLIPAMFNLHRRNLLPESFAILGSGRTSISDNDFRDNMTESIKKYGNGKELAEEKFEKFINNLFYQSLNTSDINDYSKVKEKLLALDENMGTKGNYLFYLSTPPSLFGIIARSLNHHGLNQQNNGWRRLVIEKPFGYDLKSARALNAELHRVFDENQIYRIDHYLGKETVQNLLVFRFANGIFEPLWNRNYIDHIEVTSAEFIGVEDRGGYYDHSGALRDMFQNHLMQVVGMIAMEPPSSFNADSVRNETMKVFESLRPIGEDEVQRYAVCGQYTQSTIRGQRVPSYRNENGVSPNSKTPTYVAVKFFIDNWRWSSVPFYVRTGKRLPTRVTEVAIHFKQTPHHFFGPHQEELCQSNKLIIRIQPDEGILMKFNMKLPGGGFETKSVNMDFHYADLADVYVPEAYERLLLDCMLGDATLYARGDAVEACWKFVDPILQAWESNVNNKVCGYPAGTWGPKEASTLFGNPKLDWRYPCKNLAEDGEYCEL